MDGNNGKKINDDFLWYFRQEKTVDSLRNLSLKDVRKMGHLVYIVILL